MAAPRRSTASRSRPTARRVSGGKGRAAKRPSTSTPLGNFNTRNRGGSNTKDNYRARGAGNPAARRTTTTRRTSSPGLETPIHPGSLVIAAAKKIKKTVGGR